MPHPPIRLDDATLSEFRSRLARAAPNGPEAASGTVNLALGTIAAANLFHTSIFVRPVGGEYTPLEFDSGNSVLVMPSYEQIKDLDPTGSTYRVIEENVPEPFGSNAYLVGGPIEIEQSDGSAYRIEDCTFFACDSSSPTSNFGVGCIMPVPAFGTSGTTVKSPIAYDPNFCCGIVDFADPAEMLSQDNTLVANKASVFTLCKSIPGEFNVFEILPSVGWMSLRPKSLSIAGTATGWPGTLEAPIAMIDTGGGPAFLSDPNSVLITKEWPNEVDFNPQGWKPSDTCVSVQDAITIEIGNGNSSYSFSIDPAQIPALADTPTLMMCKRHAYMMGVNGMNLGGVSALFNYIGIDYERARVGFASKSPGQALSAE